MLIFMLPFQATWAAVANYDVQSVHDSSHHFGHHEHQSIDIEDAKIDPDKDSLANDNIADVGTESFKDHVHYGFIHLSCDVGLSQCLPVFALEDHQYTNSNLFNYHSPPINTLDRPNWSIPV